MATESELSELRRSILSRAMRSSGAMTGASISIDNGNGPVQVLASTTATNDILREFDPAFPLEHRGVITFNSSASATASTNRVYILKGDKQR